MTNWGLPRPRLRGDGRVKIKLGSPTLVALVALVVLATLVIPATRPREIEGGDQYPEQTSLAMTSSVAPLKALRYKLHRSC